MLVLHVSPFLSWCDHSLHCVPLPSRRDKKPTEACEPKAALSSPQGDWGLCADPVESCRKESRSPSSFNLPAQASLRKSTKSLHSRLPPGPSIHNSCLLTSLHCLHHTASLAPSWLDQNSARKARQHPTAVSRPRPSRLGGVSNATSVLTWSDQWHSAMFAVVRFGQYKRTVHEKYNQ